MSRRKRKKPSIPQPDESFTTGNRLSSEGTKEYVDPDLPLALETWTECDMKAELAEMAADPDIQREIREINEEFGCTEMDGLEPDDVDHLSGCFCR